MIFLEKPEKVGKPWKSVNDRTSDPNDREKHVIAKSGVYMAILEVIS